ncbi:TPA: sporulation initiation inhibitor Soj [Candidatus Latescibacteria bacterium]|nr:sporulation initiation inhibitor Soj [Gemmatimonadota bacterium]HAA78594.1 sporulation initiation inhibitor Soj [Candidatus Latescibacterota bacterium]
MIIAVTNTKGGVGKTTTSVNLATGLAARNLRTLIVDLDPQGHATRCFLTEPPDRDVTDLIMEKPSQAERSILPTDYESLDIVAATDRLTETAELLQTRIRREERLSKALGHVVDEYGYIVVDCPPVLGVLSYNALVAADTLLIPVQPGVGAIAGLDQLLETAAELRDEEVEDLSYRILTTMFEIRTTRTNAMVEDLLGRHRTRLLRSIISKSESLNQANLAGKPAVAFAASSRGAQEYDLLCEEIGRLRS